MPTHWTYDSSNQDSDLQQGDILEPTEDLRLLFQDVHPYFLDSKYLAFVVLTQSCDLVRRKGTCSARYINLAVARALSEVLTTLLDTVCRERVQSGVYSDSDRNRANELLTRIFNQNEEKLGLFYLYPDGDIGLGEDAVVFLRVSVAFRAQHYDRICRARCGRLNQEFANRLGWLVGNLYARIGTRNWADEDIRKLIRGHLAPETGVGPSWVNAEAVKYLRQSGVNVESLSKDELLLRVRENVPRPKDQGIDRMTEILREVVPGLNDNDVVRLTRTSHQGMVCDVIEVRSESANALGERAKRQ